MSNIRIIYIGNELKNRGGNPTSIDGLAPLLKREGYDVITASPYKNKLFRFLHMLLVILKNYPSAKWILIDTYSTQNFWYAYFSGRLAYILDKKYILLLHGGQLPQRLQTSPTKTEWLLKNSYVNIAPSVYLKTKLQKTGIQEIKYIPNSIALKNYIYKERKLVRPKLLWVRAFADVYDPMTAIQTLELLLKKYRNAELTMVGPVKDGSYQQCRDYAKQKDLPINFTGALDKMEWHRLSENCDVFLNTSTIDNTPVSVIEAMALGLPVITTNIGGIPYLIDHEVEGMLVPPKNPVATAEAVEQLIAHPDKAQKLAFSAREKVEVFDWNLVKKMWAEVLS